MAVKISSECISCGSCADECPNTAIYPAGSEWSMADGTKVGDKSTKPAVSDDFYFVVSNKCTQCKGFNDAPACIPVCPVEAIALDPDHEESDAQLLAKKASLHGA